MNTLAGLLPGLVLLCLALTACGSGGVLATTPTTEVITATPSFEKSGNLTQLIISDGKHRRQIAWSVAPDDHPFFAVKLDPAKTYTFTLAAGSHQVTGGLGLGLVKVELEGRTIFDVAVCDVHNIRMNLKEVDVIYGLVRPPENAPAWKDEQRLFPHRREVSYGGCVLPPENERKEKLYVCPECKKVYEAWEAAHLKKK